MTPQEIDALPAGRELDALVAEKVMGIHLPTPAEMEREARRTWVVQPSAVWSHSLGGFSAWEDEKGLHLKARIKPYSTDIAAAWEVVEKLRHQASQWGTRFDEGATVRASPDAGWYAGFTKGEANAATAPLAICRAALKAVASAAVGE